jgi:glycyl-tRNA synthetase alpha subunit
MICVRSVHVQVFPVITHNCKNTEGVPDKTVTHELRRVVWYDQIGNYLHWSCEACEFSITLGCESLAKYAAQKDQILKLPMKDMPHFYMSINEWMRRGNCAITYEEFASMVLDE